MKYIGWIFLFVVLLFLGCSKEEPAPLPPLKKIDVPEGVVGLYSGRLPCENCRANIVKVQLKEDSSVVFVQNIVRGSTPDSIDTDTLLGRFSLTGDKMLVDLSEGKVRYNFQREPYGSFALLTGAGTVYRDQDDMKAELVRIYVNPLRTPADTATGDSVKKDSAVAGEK